jgi:DNA-binding FrmR family transcriptional regulator
MARWTSDEADTPAMRLRQRAMEGRVRGLRQTIDADRSCQGVVHQIDAATAAARGRADRAGNAPAHLRGQRGRGADGEEAIQETVDVLRKTLRR